MWGHDEFPELLFFLFWQYNKEKEKYEEERKRHCVTEGLREKKSALKGRNVNGIFNLFSLATVRCCCFIQCSKYLPASVSMWKGCILGVTLVDNRLQFTELFTFGFFFVNNLNYDF